MRYTITTFIAAITLAGSTAAFAATSGELAGAQRASGAPTTQTASHAVRGVVKSVGPTSLVIARSGKEKAKNLVFILTPSTLRAGTIGIGSTVSVRYHPDGQGLVATAVTARVANRVARTSPDKR